MEENKVNFLEEENNQKQAIYTIQKQLPKLS